MKYKVSGTMYYEGTVEILDKDALKDFNECIFTTDMKGLAEHIVTNFVAREMYFIEGVGSEGKEFLITEDSTWFDNAEVDEVE